MTHPNAYRARGPINVDVSRLPHDIRDALDAPVNWRPGEVSARLTRWGNREGTVVAQRLFASMEKTPLDGVDQKMVTLRVNDQHGRQAVAQLEITPEDLPAFLSSLIVIYKAQGGQLRPLLDAYQGTSKT
jgi:hypothetical protein